MKILVLNGPNLNLLGSREPDIYGTTTLAGIEDLVREHANGLGVEIGFLQSNHEGVLVDTIQEAPQCFDGIVYNPEAHTHYSIALRDAIAAVAPLPVVEVHLSDINEREEFRHLSVIEPVCIAQVKGEGPAGYVHALDILVDHINRAGGHAGSGAARTQRGRCS